MNYQASIICIGTELTSGQIANSNAAWIAHRLEAMGFEVKIHVTVPDDRALMREALDVAARHSSYLFLTGGLGPTSDDFTREVVADFVGKNLVYSEEAYREVCAKLASRNVQPTESQKRQCWFPEGSLRLSNMAGTADAFLLDFNDKKIWTLPGPPREIENVWTRHLEKSLGEVVPSAHRTRLFKWHCRGLPEAQIGEMVEEILKNSGFQIGYRASKPIVEVKVWVPQSRLGDFKKFEEQIEKALSHWLVPQTEGV